MTDLPKFPKLKDYQISHHMLGDKTIDDYQKYSVTCEKWRSEFVAQLEENKEFYRVSRVRGDWRIAVVIEKVLEAFK